LAKRKKRTWNKKISYDCRKRVADSRLRIKGRFVTKEQAVALLGTEQSADLEKISNSEIKDLLHQKFGCSHSSKKKDRSQSSEDRDSDKDIKEFDMKKEEFTEDVIFNNANIHQKNVVLGSLAKDNEYDKDFLTHDMDIPHLDFKIEDDVKFEDADMLKGFDI